MYKTSAQPRPSFAAVRRALLVLAVLGAGGGFASRVDPENGDVADLTG
jgi:hypothetical protein